MAESKSRQTPTTQGPGVLDIAKRYSTAKVMRPPVNGNGSASIVTPTSEGDVTMQKALEIKERLMANRMIDAQLRSEELDAETRQAEAEVKLQTAKVNLEKSKQELSNFRNDGDNPTMMMMGMMMEFLKEMKASQQTGIDPQVASMLNETQKDLAQMRQDIMGRISSKSSEMETVKSQVETLLAIKQIFSELEPKTPVVQAAVSGAAQDLNTTIMMARLEMDHSLRMAELERENRRWERQIELEQQKIEAEKQRAENMGKMAADTLSTLGPLIKQATDKWMVGMTGEAQVMPSAMPMTEAVQAPSTPQYIRPSNGHMAPITEMVYRPPNDIRCPNCDQPVDVKVGEIQSECQSCGYHMSIEWTEEEVKNAGA